MEPIRILHVVTSLDRGGLENMIMNFYRKLDREKVRFDFLVHKRTENGFEAEVESLGGRIFELPEKRSVKNLRKYLRALEEFFLSHREYKIVHCHINALSAFPLYAAKRAGVPVRILHSHTSKTETGCKWLFKEVLKPFARRFCNFRFACSESAGRYLFGKRAAERGDVIVVKNGIDCERFAFDGETRAVMRKRLSLSSDETVFCHVGRFDKYKNQGFVVEILSELKKDGVAARALFLGDGEDFEKVKALSKKLKVEESVLFAGVVSNVSDYLQAADVFVFPSVFEGLPLTLVEAQANGLFVFASSAISKECDLSGRVRFLPLESGAALWAKEIEKEMPFVRRDSAQKIRSAGYDSAQSAKFLERFYLEKWCL